MILQLLGVTEIFGHCDYLIWFPNGHVTKVLLESEYKHESGLTVRC